jgi:hypothetical protein
MAFLMKYVGKCRQEIREFHSSQSRGHQKGHGRSVAFFWSVGDYVQLNPARAKLVPAEQPLKTPVWSSWQAYLLPPSKRPVWLRVHRCLGDWGIPKDSPAERQWTGS